MNTMKRTLLTLLSVVCVAGAAAQGVARVSEELARPDFESGARIEVHVSDDAVRAVRNADRNSERTSITGYGVNLFSDNSQDGRRNAYAAAERFAEMYPDIQVDVSYENPWFKVTAGYFLDRTDAIALCGRILAQFRTAVVITLELPVASIVAAERFEPEVEIQE